MDSEQIFLANRYNKGQPKSPIGGHLTSITFSHLVSFNSKTLFLIHDSHCYTYTLPAQFCTPQPGTLYDCFKHTLMATYFICKYKKNYFNVQKYIHIIIALQINIMYVVYLKYISR